MLATPTNTMHQPYRVKGTADICALYTIFIPPLFSIYFAATFDTQSYQQNDDIIVNYHDINLMTPCQSRQL